ncbi:MAG: hypothetical protein AAF208_10330 [Cyanobacteria bacterium P01_A01_bin.45]
MFIKHPRRLFAALLLSLVLLTTGCATKAPGRFDQAQKESSSQRSGQAIAKDSTQGSEFNKFFPGNSDGYKRVYTQEKKGFSAANLKKDGKVLAVLSVNDTQGVKGTSNPAAKYQSASKQISGYPAIERGKQTSVLVSDRYQVKVQSKDDAFSPSDREAWIQKFNLNGLSKLN